MENDDIRAKIDRMVEIKRQQEALKTEWAELEAVFLKCGDNDLADTKRKSVAYSGGIGKVTITMAQKPEISWPGNLKRIFIDNYSKAVTEKTEYKLSAEANRIMIGIGSGEFVRRTIADVISEIPVDSDTKRLLSKKLRGAKFETDKDNLMTIGGLSERDAGDYAYFVYEAAVWESFQRLMTANRMESSDDIEEMLNLIRGTVVISETPKVALVLIEE